MNHKNEKTGRRVRNPRKSAGTIIHEILRPKSTRPAFDAIAYAAALEVLG